MIRAKLGEFNKTLETAPKRVELSCILYKINKIQPLIRINDIQVSFSRDNCCYSFFFLKKLQLHCMQKAEPIIPKISPPPSAT